MFSYYQPGDTTIAQVSVAAVLCVYRNRQFSTATRTRTFILWLSKSRHLSTPDNKYITSYRLQLQVKPRRL